MKEHIFFLMAFIQFLSLTSGICKPKAKPPHFCYGQAACGPGKWGGFCKSGRRQSPININTKGKRPLRKVDFEMNEEYLSKTQQHFYAENNGHSAQYELNPNVSELHSNLRVCGGGLSGCYRFAQLHFHWDEIDIDGSEHTIDDQRFPLEMHIVHYKDNYSTLTDALASNEYDALAVMAIFFKIGKNDGKLFEPITKALEKMRLPGKSTEYTVPIKISSFYPKEKDFARYNGSLTTPPCDEKIVWTIFLKPMTVSKNQMNMFRRLKNSEGVSDFNFRPLQPLHGREVLLFRSGGFRKLFS